jgi:hypothetical protein
VGLARLGEQVTGLPILPGNAVEPLVNGDEAYLPHTSPSPGDVRLTWSGILERT